MPANWSISACTVEASRVRMRSTPEEARLFAMALPLEVNSSVIFWRSVWTETYQVTAASGISTAARNRMILVSRPNRVLLCFVVIVRSSGLDRRRPVGDRDPPLPVHAGEIDAVEPLVALGTERQRGADTKIEVLERFERLAEGDAGRIGAGAPQRLYHDLGVDVALETDEAQRLRGVLAVLQVGRHRRVVLLHQRAVLGDGRQREVVVAGHHLRVHEPARVVAASRLAVRDEHLQHGVGADEGDVGDRHVPAEVT